MRIGNTTERAAPWKFYWTFDRFKLRNWQNPKLIYTHIGLKLLIFLLHTFGMYLPAYDWLNENYEGIWIKGNFHMEMRMYLMAILIIIDFFVTKNYLGPLLTGLHHGFKSFDEEAESTIRYHFYAEKDFLTRYSAADRDTFFTTFVIFSIIWVIKLTASILNFNWLWIPITFLGFAGLYLNFYLFVQTRYYRQWSMKTFFITWLYDWFVSVKNVVDERPASFQNAYNRQRY